MKHPKCSFLKDTSGFTLVEMAIVLVIVGLLMGAVLKGQDLLESARLKTIISQITQYRLAVQSFQDRYGALPGDYADAAHTIQAGLKNGNGNGRIDGNGLDPGSEAVGFWAHLFAAGLIPSSGPTNGTNMTFGQGIPASKLGGGITVVDSPNSDMTGPWFLLGNKNGTRGDGGLLTPQQAFSLAQKLENGGYLKGSVRIQSGSDSQGKCLNQDKLNFQEKGRVCIVYFQF